MTVKAVSMAIAMSSASVQPRMIFSVRFIAEG